jgi:hypothetical protein
MLQSQGTPQEGSRIRGISRTTPGLLVAAGLIFLVTLNYLLYRMETLEAKLAQGAHGTESAAPKSVVPLEKVSEVIATPSSTTQQVEKISGVKIHTCNTTYRLKALMPLRWSTLCPYVRHDLSSLQQTCTTGNHPPLGEVTYCELANPSEFCPTGSHLHAVPRSVQTSWNP